MPSRARTLFRDKLLPDVNQLIEAHRILNPTGRGRRKLGYITRSGVIMLCAAWELYVEDVIVEAANHIVQRAGTHNELPAATKKRLSLIAREHKHDHGPLELCGDGWRALYVASAQKEVASLNTPKFGDISVLFKKWLDLMDVERDWVTTRNDLNEFVRTRGEIAHRGADSEYISITKLRDYRSMIEGLVAKTDSRIADHVRDITTKNIYPWRRT